MGTRAANPGDRESGGTTPSEVSSSPAGRLPSLLRSYLSVRDVKTIWDIGSRDGLESQALLAAYPYAVVHAFEPNPDTYPMLAQVEKRYSRLLAHNLVLSDLDGEITFHKIDRERTETSWADGNPGASSLFEASGVYDGIEKYVQQPIAVESATAGRLLDSGAVPVPDIIWMDVQGAELLVFKGFKEHLASVKAIYVELSLKPIYHGQALADEVLAYLAKDFQWIGVPNKGAWQFDALFIRRDLGDLHSAFRNRQLRLALAAPTKPGIASRAGLPDPTHLLHASAIVASDALRTTRASSVKQLVQGIARKGLRTKSRRVRHASRMFLEASLPSDPLKGEDSLPEIDLIIACHHKDLKTLPLAIAGAREASRNAIAQTLVVTPDKTLLKDLLTTPNVLVMNQEDLLPGHILETAVRLAPPGRAGWVIQQLIKFHACLNSDRDACLVVDADTILLRPRTWLDSHGRQLLSLSHELHDPYVNHVRAIWPGTITTAVSFVTHHQLMQRELVLEMFGLQGKGLEAWIEGADWTQPSAVSEYHSYGTWLLSHHKERGILSNWGNQNYPRRYLPENVDAGRELAGLRAKFPSAWSVSAHSYLS